MVAISDCNNLRAPEQLGRVRSTGHYADQHLKWLDDVYQDE